MKSFIFMYPIPEIIDHEIRTGSYGFGGKPFEQKFLGRFNRANTEKEKEEIRQEFIKYVETEFRKFYKEKLNTCIDSRYRINGFDINYAIFKGHAISHVIELRPTDRIIEADIDFKIHTTKKDDGTYPYPDNDLLLNKLGKTEFLTVAGFHMWDCVEKIAKRSHECGIKTLVDEDLTEFFGFRIKDKSFCIHKYPGYNHMEDDHGHAKELFLENRKGKPWLWQQY
ncbi:MAG: hypothetical protein MUP55_04230 [Candidatus Aenigmarchaeota archaeon]|nr:hypothetical protein [Candidatus Aenigmarchaeota archaeon]